MHTLSLSLHCRVAAVELLPHPHPAWFPATCLKKQNIYPHKNNTKSLVEERMLPFELAGILPSASRGLTETDTSDSRSNVIQADVVLTLGC